MPPLSWRPAVASGVPDSFGRLFLQTVAMVAEFEAKLKHLRIREGMAVAKRKGKPRGKQPKLPPPARNAPSGAATLKVTCRSPTSPRNTASAAPRSIASSTGHRHRNQTLRAHLATVTPNDLPDASRSAHS